MNIVIVSSEVVPFSKTGGLADVCGALPRALAELGHTVSVYTPAYRCVKAKAQAIQPTDVEFTIPIGTRQVAGRLLKTKLPDSDVTVYLVDQPDYYDRDGLYQHEGHDHRDNCERFVFFSRAVMEAIRLLGEPIDVLHANDWQTGLMPALLNIEYRATPAFQNATSVFTIHNLAYQGRFWHWDMLLTGLDWKYFNFHQMEFWGDLNLLKTGIVFADQVTTVSQRYAEEIQTPEYGCGLEGVLQSRRDALSGILNGIDTNQWNPRSDIHLQHSYSAQNWHEGKQENKAALQAELGLPVDERIPLIGFIGRLATQKGLDLMEAVLPAWLTQHDAQFAVLGSGDPKLENFFRQAGGSHSDKLAATIGFDERLAHRIEAGSDMFLMPSRYEPCGLNQMYSLRYGTPPVVRATGGLADTVVNTQETTLQDGTANGFSFYDYSPEALSATLHRATSAWRDCHVWEQVVATGMSQDWSWRRSAAEYVELYERARESAAVASADMAR